MNSPVYFFITLDDCRTFYVPPPPTVSTARHGRRFCFILFRILTLFGSRPIPNIWERVPRGPLPLCNASPACAQTIPENYTGIRFISFLVFIFFFLHRRDRLLNNSACTLEVGSRCETVTALWVHSILVCARQKKKKKRNPLKWPLFARFNSVGFDQTPPTRLSLFVLTFICICMSNGNKKKRPTV